MKRILHITTHLGGGVGKAITGVTIFDQNTSSEYIHRIILLEKPLKMQFINRCKENQVSIEYISDVEKIIIEIEKADIVILSWWNHPKMMEFLMKIPRVPMRMILWVHINGCTYPFLPFKFASVFSQVFITTPYSLENTGWTEVEREAIRKKSELVYGMGELNLNSQIYKRDYGMNGDFTIGYVGTVDYSKMHPDFLLYCQELVKEIPNIKFVIVGEYSQDFLEEIKKAKLEEKVEVLGYVEKVEEVLVEFDVFSYLLNPYHFGTTENIILEAMLVGLPVVAINQNIESYIINNERTGILISSIEEYVKKMKELYVDKKKRALLGENARKYIIKHYKTNENMQKMHNAIERTIQLKKEIYNFEKILGDKPIDWFLSCTGEYKQSIEKCISLSKRSGFESEIKEIIKSLPHIYKMQSKSSILHFYRYYLYDNDLKLLSDAIERYRY